MCSAFCRRALVLDKVDTCCTCCRSFNYVLMKVMIYRENRPRV